jgi:hypothetical protein
MSELRYTETNAATDSAGRAFGLEGNLYLPIVLAAVAAVGIFAILSLLFRMNWVLAGTGAALPLVVSLVWVLGFRHGKPAGYDRDLMENLLGQGNFGRGLETFSLGRTHTRAPEGRFVDGLMVYGSPDRGGLVAKGFWIEPPDLRGASFARLNALQDQLKATLALVSPGRRVQFQWWPDADYRSPIHQYHARFEAEPDPVIRAVGNERVARYWPRMIRGDLRRERLAVFLSIEITRYAGNAQGTGGLRRHYESVLKEMAGQFEEFAGTLVSIFGAETPVRPMDDLTHFACARRFLNPSLVRRNEEDLGVLFDLERSLQENCWHCDAVAQPEGGFHLDGYYHAVLTLDRWPKQTRPGIVTHLTGLPFLDYCITVNVTPAAVRQEIGREEAAAERLRGEYSAQPRTSALVALRKKEKKIEQLAAGFARPFLVTYVVRVWADSRELLRERVAAVQAAINAMAGAQYLECALPTTAKKLFFATWPGWTHSAYGHRELYAEDQYLADLLPFSSTFTGELARAEALFDGVNLNLVGVCTEAGGSPQHALVCGMTGSGKSEFIHDLFFQTAGLFQYTLIADIGFSHRRLTEALGEKPMVIHPDADLTLNYLDTHRAPLTQLQVASAVALLARMVGVPENAEVLALRQAQLTQYVHQLYRDTYLDWSRQRPERAAEVRRLACAVHRWRERMPAGTGPLEAFVDLRDRKAAGEDEAMAFIAGLPEAEVTRFGQEPTTAPLVAATACAFYRPEEFPTHSALVELLAYARMPEHGEEVAQLATLLRAWSADGQYGRLFDGVTNVSLQRKVAHFELGLIPEQAVELKAAVGLLISGLARQHIISLPRAVRKRVLFEEVSQFLDIPGGEQIVAESYAQLRKHRCWAVSVVQQYSRFRASRIRAAVVGNTKQFFLLRQSDRSDMQDLARDVGLPESAVEAIQRYPLPEQQPAGAKYSSVCCYLPTAQPPQCGTLRHIQAREESCA